MQMKNNKAYRDYEFEEEYEAGIKLKGTEVKSLREGRASIDGAYAKVERGEVFLYSMNIPRYEHAGVKQNHDPERRRKLLLRKNQIQRLIGLTERKGYTLIPTRLYFKNGYAKLNIAVAQPKEQRDKRDEIKKKEAERKMRRAMKNKRNR